MTDSIFITLDYLKANTTIHENVDSKTVRPYIVLAMDKHLLPTLGTNLYNRLVSDVQTNSLSGNYQTLMQVYIQPNLLYWVQLESIRFINWQFTNKAISKKNSDNSESAGIDEIIFLEEAIRPNAQYYAERLTKYLRANQSLFPEFTNNTGDIDKIRPIGTNYFSGIHIPGNNLAPRYVINENGQIIYPT